MIKLLKKSITLLCTGTYVLIIKEEDRVAVGASIVLEGFPGNASWKKLEDERM